jgi:DNA-binding beta-propeller fold protein YncE
MLGWREKDEIGGRRMLRHILAVSAALLAMTAAAVAAPRGDRVGTWNPQPFAHEGPIEFIVTQESPAARKQQKSRTAGSSVYFFGRDGAILRVARPNAVLGPRGARTDKQGSVVFADIFGPAIKRMEADGTIATLASGSPLTGPKDIAFDATDNLVIADFDDFNDTRRSGILLYEQSTKKIKTVYEGKPLLWPHGIDVDKDGNYVVADHSGAIFRLTPAGRITTVATGQGLVAPQDIKVQADGSYVATDIALSLDKFGKLIVEGSRNPSKLVRVTPDGQVSTIYQQRKARFRAVVNHPAGGWVVLNMGAAPRSGDVGSLIRVYPGGKAAIIHEGAPLFQPAGITILQ